MQGLLDHQLILVIAPVGYGKTTALIDFTSNLEMPTCWYGAWRGGSQSVPFCRSFYCCHRATISQFWEGFKAALENLEAGRIPYEQFVTLVVNELYVQVHQRFVFVIDDYHLVDDFEPISSFVSQFLQDVGNHCHMILASRHVVDAAQFGLARRTRRS